MSSRFHSIANLYSPGTETVRATPQSSGSASATPPGNSRATTCSTTGQTIGPVDAPGGVSVDNCEPVAQLVREWKATTEMLADPELAPGLVEPLKPAGDPVPAPRG